MNNLIIRSIADYAISNDKEPDYGLFSGLSGKCIFLYELSKALNIREYERKADHLIDRLFNNREKQKLIPDFANGLAGIGWTMEYLLKHGYCKGNRNEILEEIDITVFREMNKSNIILLGFSEGLIGYLLYYVSRLESNQKSANYLINTEIFKVLINKIDRMAPDFFPLMNKDFKFDLFLIFPMLFHSLAKSLKLNIYNDKIINTIKQWVLYIETLMPGLHSNRLNLAISLLKLNEIINFPEIDRQIKLLLYSINFDVLKKECDYNAFNIMFGWVGQVFLLKQASILFDSNYPNYDKFEIIRKELIRDGSERYENKILKSLEKTDSTEIPKTGLVEGLSGIGMMFLKYPSAFE